MAIAVVGLLGALCAVEPTKGKPICGSVDMPTFIYKELDYTPAPPLCQH
jgi:hypothetical protein